MEFDIVCSPDESPSWFDSKIVIKVFLEFIYLLATIESHDSIHIKTLSMSMIAVLNKMKYEIEDENLMSRFIYSQMGTYMTVKMDGYIEIFEDCDMDGLSLYRIPMNTMEDIYKKHFYTSRLLLYSQ